MVDTVAATDIVSIASEPEDLLVRSSAISSSIDANRDVFALKHYGERKRIVDSEDDTQNQLSREETIRRKDDEKLFQDGGYGRSEFLCEERCTNKQIIQLRTHRSSFNSRVKS